MTTRPYLTVARLTCLAAELSPRQTAILHTLARIRIATSRQIERVHFVELTPLSAARQCRRTLARLHTLGLLARLHRRIGGARAGSASYLYTLTTPAHHLVTTHDPAGGNTPRRPWTPSPPFLHHALAVTELYVRLVELTRREPLELVEFSAEPACWRTFPSPHGSATILKPDAHLILTTTTYEDRYFIEIDRATQSPATLARKAQTYRQYWMSGQEQTHHQIFPRVLFLVPHQPRQTIINEVMTRQPADSHPLYHTALFEQTPAIFQVDDQP